jgi:CRP-like cAMP-binding protein
VFSEGSPGGNCFIILQGTVDVSVNTRGQQQLLATLNPGSVFGQMSLIDGVPRSATCSVRTDAVLLELVRAPCEELMNSGSTLALKFLATLNEGLILALRGADLRLMQLEGTEAQANL